jgi:lipopolysaccharide export LptBFGC system permease protein LptF
MTKKTKIICAVVAAFFVLGVALTISSDAEKYKADKQAKQQTQQSPEPTNQKPISAIQKNDLAGFNKPTITKLSNGYIIASYITSAGNMSVTVMDNGSLTSHDDSLYGTDKGTITIEGIEVVTGYTTPSEFANPYQSLAFDFKIGEFTYSGEVSHLGLDAKQSGDKQKLLETLTNFVKSMKKEV